MCRLAPHLHSSRTWCYHVLAATNAVMNKSHSTDWLPCLHSSRTWHCHVLAATNIVMAYLPPWQEMWHQQLHKIKPQTGHCCQNTISIIPSATKRQQHQGRIVHMQSALTASVDSLLNHVDYSNKKIKKSWFMLSSFQNLLHKWQGLHYKIQVLMI